MHRYDGSLRRVARSFVRSEAVAEEVVQDTWLAVVRGLGPFEGRSSLRTWIFSILVNRARTRAVREARTVPFSTLAAESEGPTVDPARFGADDMWAAPPRRLATDPEQRLLAQELRGELLAAVEALAPTASARSSPSATSRAYPPRRCVSCSTSPPATSACSCTAPAHASARPLVRRPPDAPQPPPPPATREPARLPRVRRARHRLPRRRAPAGAARPLRGAHGRLRRLHRLPRGHAPHGRRDLADLPEPPGDAGTHEALLRAFQDLRPQ